MPADLLPSTLQHLGITYPKITIYDWLALLTACRRGLAVLNMINLHCAGSSRDGYNIFAFESYPHPVSAALRSVGVTMALHYRWEDWEEAWDEYDLKALNLVA